MEVCRISFTVVCFTTSKCAYQLLNQIASNVKRFRIVLWMNVMQNIGFKNSGWKICSSVMNLSVDGHKHWILKPCRRPCLACIEENSSLTYDDLVIQLNISVKQLHFICTFLLRRTGWTSRLHILCWKSTRHNKWQPVSLLFRHLTTSIFNHVLTSDEKWILYDTPRRHPRILSLTLQNQRSITQDYALFLVDRSSRGSLWTAVLGAIGHCRPVLVSSGTCALQQKEPALVNRKGDMIFPM